MDLCIRPRSLYCLFTDLFVACYHAPTQKEPFTQHHNRLPGNPSRLFSRRLIIPSSNRSRDNSTSK